jgi:hypothetical protein
MSTEHPTDIPDAEIEAAGDALRELWNSDRNQQALKETGHGASWRYQAQVALEAAARVRGRLIVQGGPSWNDPKH